MALSLMKDLILSTNKWTVLLMLFLDFFKQEGKNPKSHFIGSGKTLIKAG